MVIGRHFTRSVSRNRRKFRTGATWTEVEGDPRAGVREGIHLALQISKMLRATVVGGFAQRTAAKRNWFIAFAAHEKNLEYHGIGPLPYT